eukprot:gene7555-8840_t
MTSNITKTPWITNYYVCDGLSTLFGTKKASAFASGKTPAEVRSVKSLKVSQETITTQEDYTRALSSSVTASASVLAWGVSGETKNSFANDRNIGSNTLHFLIRNYFIKEETVLSREQIDGLAFSPAALKLIKEKKFDEFKEAYGDSFITGYGAGGNYNGVISIQTFIDKTTTDMQASLSSSFEKVSFTANGAVDFTNKLNSYSATSKITVTVQGTGIALKTIAIGDINKMVADAGNLESLGASRLYAVVMSYDDLPQFKTATAAAPVDLQPKVKPTFAATMNELFYEVCYGINSKQTKLDYYTKMITDPGALASAKTKLNAVIVKLQNYKQLFEVLTVKDVENMSANPAANAKWVNILKVNGVLGELRNLTKNVGIVGFGTPQERALLKAKMDLLNQNNAAGWDASPSERMKSIINDMRADPNPLIDFYTEYLQRTNDTINEVWDDIGWPRGWRTNDDFVNYATQNMALSFSMYFISDAERTAVKVHLDELNAKNELKEWQKGDQWITNWVNRATASASCAYFVNLCWQFKAINDNCVFYWWGRYPEPIITKLVLAGKFIYDIK